MGVAIEQVSTKETIEVCNGSSFATVAPALISPLQLSGASPCNRLIGDSLPTNNDTFGHYQSTKVSADINELCIIDAAAKGLLPVSMAFRSLRKIDSLEEIDQYLNGTHGLIGRALNPFIDWLQRETRRSKGISSETKLAIQSYLSSEYNIGRNFMSFSILEQGIVMDRHVYSISYFPPVSELPISVDQLNDLLAWLCDSSIMNFQDWCHAYSDMYEDTRIDVKSDIDLQSAAFYVDSVAQAIGVYGTTDDSLVTLDERISDKHKEEVNYLLEEGYDHQTIACSTSVEIMRYAFQKSARVRHDSDYKTSDYTKGQSVAELLARSPNDLESVCGRGLLYLKSRLEHNVDRSITPNDGLDAVSNINLLAFDDSWLYDSAVWPVDCPRLPVNFIETAMDEWQNQNDEYAGNCGDGESCVGQEFTDTLHTEKEVIQSIRAGHTVSLALMLIDLLGFSQQR